MEDLESMFWNNVDKNGPVVVPELGECWVWTACTRTGYGIFMERIAPGPKGRTTRSAHRYSWAWANGVEYPGRGIVVRHKCDNPPCVRADHLESGDFWDNNHDKMKRDRMRHTALTNDLVTEARNRARTGESLHKIVKDMPEGTDVQSLAMAVRGESFPYAESDPVANPSFAKKRYQKLSDEEYTEILEALRVPWRGQGLYLAQKYGVDKSLISKIKQGAFLPASLNVA